MWIQMKDAWRRDGDCQWLSMAAIDCLTVSDSWRSAARCRRVVAGDVACRRSGRTRKCDANASSLPASVEDVMVCKAWHVMQLWFFWQADLIIQRQIEALLSSHLLWRVRKQDRSPPAGKRLVYRFTTIIYSCHDATWTPVQDLCELIVWGESDQFLDTDRGGWRAGRTDLQKRPGVRCFSKDGIWGSIKSRQAGSEKVLTHYQYLI